jgi:hypothetical protein
MCLERLIPKECHQCVETETDCQEEDNRRESKGDLHLSMCSRGKTIY